jgi:hypothetical protein
MGSISNPFTRQWRYRNKQILFGRCVSSASPRMIIQADGRAKRQAMTTMTFKRRSIGWQNLQDRKISLSKTNSLIPRLGVKVSTIILAGPTVLSALGRALRMSEEAV